MEFIKSHPAVIITFAVIVISSLGIIHDFVLFGQFGINYFEYADVDDFIVAAGKILRIVGAQDALFYIGMAIYLIVGTFVSAEIIKRQVKKNPEKTSLVSMLSVQKIIIGFLPIGLIVTLGYLAFSTANEVAQEIISGDGTKVLVELRSGVSLPAKIGSLQFVGGTNTALVFYEIPDKKSKSGPGIVHVVPIQNILVQTLILP